jgi:hypothetical protein
MRHEISFDYAESVRVTIYDTGEGFGLICGDYVANEWEEIYPSLSLALLRAAVLVGCGECNFRGFFTSNSEEFTKVGAEFLRSQVSLPEGGGK